MLLLARLRALLNGLVLRRRAERELDEELTAYLELTVAEKLRDGADPAAARRQALLELGGAEQVKEGVRDVRAGIVVETAVRDLRYGLRSLARTPAFTAAAVLALALGIGGATAIFSVVNAVLLRPLPFADPERLVVVLHERTNPVAPANYFDWKRKAASFTAMGAADYWTPNLTGLDAPESILAIQATSELLPMLGVAPRLGRFFLKEEEEAGAHVAVLSDRLWKRRFASDPSLVGRQVSLNGEAYTVVGVMPPGFEFPPFWARGTELWAPLPLRLSRRAASREGRSLRVFARLKPRIPLAAARAEIAAITARLEKEYPGTNRNVHVNALEEIVVGDVRTPLIVLLCAVGCVLLIACANVAHMLLARATSRGKELALRAALGAGRARLVRQLLTEVLVLAFSGGAAGVLLAAAAVRLLKTLGPSDIPRIETAGLDSGALAFALATSVLTGLAFGLVPALKASLSDPAGALRDGGRGGTEGPARSRLRGLLVASEFGLSMVLLVGAGLLVRSFAALRSLDPGFDPRGLLTLTVSVTGSPEAEPGRRAAFYEEALRGIRALPAVSEAGAINHLPLGGDTWLWPFAVEGRASEGPGQSPHAVYRVVLPGYFKAMRIPLLRGRDVGPGDRLGAPGVVVVNDWLARHYWPGEDPLGKRITLDDRPSPDANWLTVVGVAKNTARGDWSAEPENEMYLSYEQTREYLERPTSVFTYMTFVARARGNPAALVSDVRGVIRSLAPGVTIGSVQTMEQVVSGATAEPRFYSLLLVAFAGSALTLAAVGIYGVMSYAVSRRTHEIGIRVALGAERRDVMRLVVGQGMGPALSGAAAGLGAALLLTRLMQSLLYGVRATDALTFLAAGPLLAAVALGASYLPARRAMRIDPLTALRSD
jgi:predicted permease